MRKFFLALWLIILSPYTYANLPYFPLSFPRDEAAHYKSVPYSYSKLIEWWYFNGKMTSDDGKNLAYDVAIFNAGALNGTVTKPMLHIQVVDLDKKKTFGAAKEYFYNTGKFATDKLDIVVNDDYSLHKSTINGKDVYVLKTEATNDNTTLKLDLMLESTSPIFLINSNGLMPMPDDTNSYYYTIPHFKTTGTITINDVTYQANLNTGDSWMDHQWGDFNVDKYGWEWFSVRLENGLIANIFLNIAYKNHTVVAGLANIILPSGEKKFISYQDFIVNRDDYWFDEKLAMSFPTTFTFNFPTLGLTLRNVAAFPEQEVHGYWEGYCNVNGVYNKQDVNGFSYTELVYS